MNFGVHFSLIFNWSNYRFVEDQWIQIDSFFIWNSWVLRGCASNTHHGFSFDFVILTLWQKNSKKFAKLVKFTLEKNSKISNFFFSNFFNYGGKSITTYHCIIHWKPIMIYLRLELMLGMYQKWNLITNDFKDI
jgi:hypothetical protein